MGKGSITDRQSAPLTTRKKRDDIYARFNAFFNVQDRSNCNFNHFIQERSRKLHSSDISLSCKRLLVCDMIIEKTPLLHLQARHQIDLPMMLQAILQAIKSKKGWSISWTQSVLQVLLSPNHCLDHSFEVLRSLYSRSGKWFLQVNLKTDRNLQASLIKYPRLFLSSFRLNKSHLSHQRSK